MTHDDDYYWASGQKIPLQTEAQLVVNPGKAEEQGLWQGELSTVADADGTDIGSGLVMVPGDTLSTELRNRLDQAGVSAPVYRAEDSLIVVLPEIRMEAANTNAGDVRTAVQEIDSGASVEESMPGRFVVKPSSGRGVDALNLANRLTEDMQPDAAQARFVRITEPHSPTD